MTDRERTVSLGDDDVAVWSCRRRQSRKNVDAAFIVAARAMGAKFAWDTVVNRIVMRMG